MINLPDDLNWKILIGISVVILVITSFTFMSGFKEIVVDFEILHNTSQNQAFDTELEEDVKIEIDPKTFNVSIASEMTVSNKDFTTKANIKNISNEGYYFIVNIVLDDETIYTSPVIVNDDLVEIIQFNKELEIGEYKAKAFFHIYDENTETQVTSMTFDIKLNVMKTL